MISYIRTGFLTLLYGIINFYDIPYDMTPHLSNDIYLAFYGLLWTCATYKNFYGLVQLSFIFYSSLQSYFTWYSICFFYTYSMDVWTLPLYVSNWGKSYPEPNLHPPPPPPPGIGGRATAFQGASPMHSISGRSQSQPGYNQRWAGRGGRGGGVLFLVKNCVW